MTSWIVAVLVLALCFSVVALYLQNRAYRRRLESLDSRRRSLENDALALRQVAQGLEARLEEANERIRRLTEELISLDGRKASDEIRRAYEARIQDLQARLAAAERERDAAKNAIEEVKKHATERAKRAVEGSRNAMFGKFAEQFAPLMRDFPASNPAAIVHIGGGFPCDYLVLDLDKDGHPVVRFIEVKLSGGGKPTENERLLQRAISDRRVQFVVFRLSGQEVKNAG
jgi:predicted Holliday junction resolvase-like endonuclease